MSSPTLGEFNSVAVRIMSAHRALPWLFMRWFKKLNSSGFQFLVQRVKIVCTQLDMNFRSLLQRFARSRWISDNVREQPNRSARWPSHTDHRELWSFVDVNRKAELALEKKKDEQLARAALERSLSAKQLAASFAEQVADQKSQVEILKIALSRLEQKLAEARAKSDLLIAQHRRSRSARKAGEAHAALHGASQSATFDRMKDKVMRSEAVGQAHVEINGESLDDRFAALEKEQEIDRLLAEIKTRRSLPA